MDLARISWKLIAAILILCAAMMVVAVIEYDDLTVIYILLAAVIVLTVLMLIVVLASRNISAKMEYDGLHVAGPFLSVKIPYGEISSTEMRDTTGRMNYGIRIGGYGGIDRLGGRFRNSEFGNYKLGVSVSVGKNIIIRYNENKVLVFNLETADKTEQFYGELRRMVGK